MDRGESHSAESECERISHQADEILERVNARLDMALASFRLKRERSPKEARGRQPQQGR